MALTSAFSAPQWIRVTSGNIEVTTDAGVAVARRMLRRFELARAVFHPRDPIPTRVLILSSERDYRALRPAETAAAFFQSGPASDYIVMQAPHPEAMRVALHEYTHLVLSHNSAALPQWLEEGLAEFYSTLELSGSRIRIGEPVPSHLAILAGRRWLTAAELSRVAKGSPELNNRDLTTIFYAQSWALAHMLAASPGYRERFDAYPAALAAGAAPEAAFRGTFLKTIGQALDDLRRYLARPLPFVEVDAPAGIDGSGGEIATVPEGEAILQQADLLMLGGRGAEAEKLLAGLARRHPDWPQAHTGLATLALRDRDYAAARGHFARALSLGGASGPVLFEYAMLLRDTGGSREEVNAYLEKAVAASPTLAEAHFLLGVRASDDGRYPAAVEHLRRAAGILPRQAYFWHALAYAYHRTGDPAKSREAAFRARNAAVSSQEIEMAEAVIRLSAPQQPELPPRPAVTTPESWENPRGDARVEGRLTQVDCGEPLRLHVGKLVLEVADPKRVVLKGTREASADLRCGRQDAVVAVEYNSLTRQVTLIEFR